ncbi:UvrD-like helicase C-terminal domain-containing protein [Roseateles sp. YR242]|uniref:DEAD/DEAH box helicase n=1 Tax=Roseateles sp. YR242 TaxID=1855305 RepID=UPI0008AFE56A|nr:3'-5' exonuclease [Roseateles sp. YR242]SEK60655.1 UvrD-like helicase C-terminal domain-containing protein [Roseateles sp. YR242]
MAVLIPAMSACAGRMTPGERRIAERLEGKLDEDYMLWYDVPVGPKQTHPDFVIIHPRRGILILEAKDWLLDTIQEASRETWTIFADNRVKSVVNPAMQVRHCAIQVVNALERDAELILADGPHRGKLAFPWGSGVVFTNITRKQFEQAGLDQAIEPHLVICKDEMLESAEPEAFQQRLWNMFPHAFGKAISVPQLERVRWIMFPQVRVPVQGSLLSEDPQELPSIMRVMDIQQEQLARSLGEGHRVIHGVAGSGKTMILGYRAELLANAHAIRPILVLCYNEPLAVKLTALFAAKGLTDRVHVRNFHKWCRQQLVAYGQPIPPQGPGMFDQMVHNVIRGVDRKQIPSGQYQAVMVDEGHDFQPEWLKLVTQMVDPETNSLLILYDSAQDIYGKSRARGFSFKSVGIQAAGRTTILKINYRNTKQILQTANRVAAEFLQPDMQDDDGVPLVQPLSCGREGPEPLIVRVPTPSQEPTTIAGLLSAAHQEGHAWGDMAILCRDHSTMDQCARSLSHRRLPHHVRHRSGDFDPLANTIKVMTMHASKGLEFPVVAIAGVGRMPHGGEEPADEAKLFYVAATRATHKLIVAVSGDGAFANALV